MKGDLSGNERDVRGAVLAPIALLFAFAVGVTSLAGILGIAAAVGLFLTALAGYCPVYALLKRKETEQTAG